MCIKWVASYARHNELLGFYALNYTGSNMLLCAISMWDLGSFSCDFHASVNYLYTYFKVEAHRLQNISETTFMIFCHVGL